VESTIAPGTVRDVVRPLLEQHSGRKAGQDFFLGACPERVMPGKLLANLRTMSRVCGGDTLSTAQMMVQLYRHIVEADLDIADIITAELVKTAENAYRDVQIAFANEVALICEANGADVWQVRDLVNKSPFRQMHMPGAGVGGHCIPKDPWLLVYGAPADVPVRLIPAARTINESMPHHVAELTLAALGQAGQPTSGARVLVLGYAYLADSDDTRNSPSVALIEHLHHRGVVPVVHDPWVAEYRGDVLERAAGCVAAIFMVAHRAYNDLDLESLRAALAAPVLIDGRGMFEPRALQARGWFYRGVGR
jgi:UDP-N-acetyl-D-mannosaminuronic acid dehydrogenase